jgi:FtsH-binding integral membrane protein
MDFLKSMGGKVLSGAVALAVIAGGISWWQMDQSTRDGLITGTGHVIAWLGVVLLLPWATFFLIGRVARVDSNAAGAALVFAYTVAEAILLAWLFGWSISGPAALTFAAAAVLVAGVYNLFTCDWIAEKVAG